MKKELSKHIASFIILAVFGILAVGSTDTDTDTLKIQSQEPTSQGSKDSEQKKPNSDQPRRAAITYTPEQLNRMISNGQFPEQGEVENTETREASFAECKVVVESVMSEIRGIYPVQTIVDTKIMYMVKAWTNTGVVIATCSQPDRKLTLISSSYK